MRVRHVSFGEVELTGKLIFDRIGRHVFMETANGDQVLPSFSSALDDEAAELIAACRVATILAGARSVLR